MRLTDPRQPLGSYIPAQKLGLEGGKDSEDQTIIKFHLGIHVPKEIWERVHISWLEFKIQTSCDLWNAIARSFPNIPRDDLKNACRYIFPHISRTLTLDSDLARGKTKVTDQHFGLHLYNYVAAKHMAVKNEELDSIEPKRRKELTAAVMKILRGWAGAEENES